MIPFFAIKNCNFNSLTLRKYYMYSVIGYIKVHIVHLLNCAIAHELRATMLCTLPQLFDYSGFSKSKQATDLTNTVKISVFM